MTLSQMTSELTGGAYVGVGLAVAGGVAFAALVADSLWGAIKRRRIAGDQTEVDEVTP